MLKEIVRKLRGVDAGGAAFQWRVDSGGLNLITGQHILSNIDELATENLLLGYQVIYLKSLEEQGLANPFRNGWEIPSANAVDLEDDFADLFELPPKYEGGFQSRIKGQTTQSAFQVNVSPVLRRGEKVSYYELAGPFLKLADKEFYRLNPAEWRALKALKHHQSLPPEDRGEYENNWLVFQLQLAAKAGMKIDLAHFDKLEIVHPEKVGVALEELLNGDLLLSPTYGAGINVDDVKSRLGQIAENDGHSILRVRDQFVLLDEKRLEATHEILTNKRIPKDQIAVFLKSPTAYLDAALIDLDTGFSLRAHGAEKFTHRYFGDVEESGIDWFAMADSLLEPPQNLKSVVRTEDDLKQIEQDVINARCNGADSIECEGRTFDITDTEKVAETFQQLKVKIESNAKESTDQDDADVEVEDTSARAVVNIDLNDEDDEFVKSVMLESFDPSKQSFGQDNLKRSPYPHQDEGIKWLLAHFVNVKSKPDGGGALLADDMGLGKTYMALVAIEEWYRRCKESDQSLKPTLIVAPLSLLENWQAEVDDTFHKSPFSDIVVLQASADLRQYRIAGGKRETQQEFEEGDIITEQDQIRYSLKVGSVYGSDRLDQPGRLVLTTYQTLRDYQFSMSRIDWGVVAFDEAQNLKNPNALATRAAKALKADFRLLATGTPVENSLKDFWCLLDTAVPGLLGAWQAFRENYIAPITRADAEDVREIKGQVGLALREAVGEYMLRRTKEGNLKGLPAKRIFTGDQQGSPEGFMPILAGMMSGQQLIEYDEVIDQVQSSSAEDRRGLVLPSLLKLKVTSIHHDINRKAAIPEKTKDLLRQAESSTKISSLLSLLKDIEKRQEKVLIFATTKAVQAYVCVLVSSLFKVPVEVINGDTKAVATKKDDATRKGIIDRFQEKEGFGVIVMSPVAAGVGLTIVGANNVIHLERHWNPAKEAQATDRVYRIGQTRDVNVYLPMALHPNSTSFDLKLNSLLTNKIDLSDAVVSTAAIEAADLGGCFTSEVNESS